MAVGFWRVGSRVAVQAQLEGGPSFSPANEPAELWEEMKETKGCSFYRVFFVYSFQILNPGSSQVFYCSMKSQQAAVLKPWTNSCHSLV